MLQKKREEGRIKTFLEGNNPGVQVKMDYEMEGLIAPVVIFISNQGPRRSSISIGFSRASTKLIVITPDEKDIMQKAVREGVVLKVNMKELLVPENFDTILERKKTSQRAYTFHDILELIDITRLLGDSNSSQSYKFSQLGSEH